MVAGHEWHCGRGRPPRATHGRRILSTFKTRSSPAAFVLRGGPRWLKQKLVGQNYSTPDLRAKVTGRARYAEDFRARRGCCSRGSF